MKKKYIIPIFIPNFACNFRCIFCEQKKFTTKEISSLNEINFSEIINEHISYYKDKNPENIEIAFYGGTFTALKLFQIEDILKSVNQKGLKEKFSKIRLSTRPDKINATILDLLKKNRVSTIELGIQSIFRDVLLKNKRPVFMDQIIKSSEMIKESGISLGHQYMIGLYGSNKKKDIQTVLFGLLTCKPEFIRLYPTLVVKNTELEELYENGEYRVLSLKKSVNISLRILIISKALNIDIIRMGIYNDPEMNEDDIIAGPYFPNYSDLVYSKLFYLITLFVVKTIYKNSKIVISAKQKNYSHIIGYKKENLKKLKKYFDKIEFLIDNDLDQNYIIFDNSHKKIELNIEKFIKALYKKIVKFYTI